MLQVQRGINLFISSDGDLSHRIAGAQEIGMGLLKFLSNDFNYLTLNFTSMTFGSPSHSKVCSVTETNYKKIIQDNSFRLDGLFIYIKNIIVDVDGFWDYLKSLEFLQIFVFLDESYMKNFFRDEKVIARQIFKLTPNKNRKTNIFVPSGTSLNVISSVYLASKDPMYILTDILTGEHFTLKDFEVSYIRDKKLGILLDKNRDM